MASTSFSSSSKYDVSLSFRGGDTRDNFTSHLYAALCRKKIKTFINGDEIRRGDDISPALFTAIQGSKISVIVLSKHYASSKWCLHELVKILECKSTNGQIVVPVFYHVDPSDVRKQTGSFRDAFVKHKKQMAEKVQKWRDALTEASNLSGWNSMTIRSEAELVDVIVKDILKKLENITVSTNFDGLVGLNSRIEKIKSLLCIGRPDFRIVGIWGMGGTGKTTLAGAIFNLIYKEFEGNCFLGNVREESEKGGSRIIITTRDKWILDKFGVHDTNVYEVNGLRYHEALELFCNCAFKENHCPSGFLASSKRVLNYNDLSLEEKSIFLDIACFFAGEEKDYVTRMLDPNFPHNGLNILIAKSLVTVSNDNKIQMHDLLQEMGREVVRQECIKEPGKRSRLWYHEDVYHVLKKNKRGFGLPSRGLRYLHWHEHPLKTLPSDFDLENIIELNLPYSKVEQIWEGKKEAFKLKYIDLHHSHNLLRIPEPSEVPHLERISLSNCASLPYNLPNLQNFSNLGLLSLRNCESLSCFPRNIHFKSPIKIDCSWCVNLKEFPQISGNVVELKLWSTPIEEVPSSIEWLTNLKTLDLKFCRRLKKVSTSICKLKSLSFLDLFCCANLESFPEILEQMELLQEIDLFLSGIKELPSSIEHIEGLKCLRLNSCTKLGFLPESLCNLKKLQKLCLSQCRCLILSGLSSLSSLKCLELSGHNFESLPTGISQLQRLKCLHLINCNMIRSLPELPFCLNYLNTSDCKRLQSLPKISSCLETPSNQTRGNSYLPVMFKFVNCVKLHKGTERNFFANFQRRVHNALPGILHRKTKAVSSISMSAVNTVLITLSYWWTPCPFTRIMSYLDLTPCWNIELPEGDPHTTVSFEFFIRDVISPSDSRIHHKVKCCGVSPVYAIPNQDTTPNSFTLKFAASNEEECTQHGIVHSSDEDENAPRGSTDHSYTPQYRGGKRHVQSISELALS
ncbi:Disease resistance-like protein DSC1 [Citrus sinensis]|nr:Disease resistance-like protein DSC1 [Citrus sinensis]